MKFNESDLHTIESALTIAAEIYDKDAKTCRDSGDDRIATEFATQAKECRALIDRIQGEGV